MSAERKNRFPRCSDRDLESIKRCEDAQRQLRESVLERRGFSNAEKRSVQLTSIEDFRTYWTQATNAQEDFDGEHEAGCGLCARRYQSSAELVVGFMDDFNPILSAVKDFAAPYGGLAIGIISLVFVVARNKNTVEDTLASTISEIRNRLPGIDLYQRIYDDDHPLDHSIQAQIVAAYQSFIDFCIAATKYYKSSPVRRWLSALGLSQSLANSATDVQDSFVNIERTSHELLAKSVDEIKGENKDLKKQILGREGSSVSSVQMLTEAELRDQLTNSDKDAFEQTFRLGVFSEELQGNDLATYRQRLATDLELNFQGLQRLRGPHFDEFTSSGVYRQWDTSLQPRLLILSGRNFPGLSSPQSWLSWVATSTIERQRRSSAYCAYYIVTEQGATLYQVLPSILLQLIAKKKDMLRMDDQRDGLRAELHEFQQSEKSGIPNKYGNDGRTDVLLKIATRVVRFFSRSDEVYIIVDRADLCTDIAGYDHRGSLVRALVQMVSSAHCRIKILVVINSSLWDVKEHQDELRISSHDQVVVHTMDQNMLH